MTPEEKRQHKNRLARERYARMTPEEKKAKFDKEKATNLAWKLRNPEKVSAGYRNYEAKHPKRSAPKQFRRLLRQYGITLAEYFTMILIQSHRCKICQRDMLKGIRMHVDHCHSTGKVRGILCLHCNHLLGNARDDVEVLKNAIVYLEKTKSC